MKSDPSSTERLLALAFPAILGLVGALLVWRTFRAVKNARRKAHGNKKSSNEELLKKNVDLVCSKFY